MTVRNGFSVRIRYVYSIDVITQTLLMSKNVMFIHIFISKCFRSESASGLKPQSVLFFFFKVRVTLILRQEVPDLLHVW
jgi:hypothetical protein